MLILLSLLTGCYNDFGIVDLDEGFDPEMTHVVVDAYRTPDKNNDLDILFSLDTSCSMGSHADVTTQGLGEIRTLIDPNFAENYQIGLISADENFPNLQGPYTKDTPIWTVSSGIDNLFSSFAPGERAISAIISYLLRDDVFVREDSDLLIFTVSDADDQGFYSSQDFYDFLVWYRPDMNFDVVNITVVPQNLTCGEGQGTKYIELADMLQKTPIDICRPGWNVWLESSSYLILQTREFKLTHLPIESSIVVYIEKDQIWNWTYDEVENQIILDEIPENDVEVIIGYKVADY